MTGTAATQAEELWRVYKLPVTVIPTNRPVIRQDLPDVVYADKAARDDALVAEIRKVHATGRPMLVGTGSVEESERLSARLQVDGVPHAVLNARNDEAEAEIVAQAGALGAVTIIPSRTTGRTERQLAFVTILMIANSIPLALSLAIILPILLAH
jgi:preprotein translocase subunit SecA